MNMVASVLIARQGSQRSIKQANYFTRAGSNSASNGSPSLSAGSPGCDTVTLSRSLGMTYIILLNTANPKFDTEAALMASSVRKSSAKGMPAV